MEMCIPLSLMFNSVVTNVPSAEQIGACTDSFANGAANGFSKRHPDFAIRLEAIPIKYSVGGGPCLKQTVLWPSLEPKDEVTSEDGENASGRIVFSDKNTVRRPHLCVKAGSWHQGRQATHDACA